MTDGKLLEKESALTFLALDLWHVIPQGLIEDGMFTLLSFRRSKLNEKRSCKSHIIHKVRHQTQIIVQEEQVQGLYQIQSSSIYHFDF